MMKDKLLLITTDVNHIPLYYQIYKMFNSTLNISILTNRKIANRIDSGDRVSIFIADEISFLKMFSILKNGNHQYIILDEIYGNPITYLPILLSKSRNIYITHNIQKHTLTFYRNCRQVVKQLLTMLIFRSFDAHIGVGANTLKRLIENGKNGIMIPFNYEYLLSHNKSVKKRCDPKSVKIVIPGRTDMKKRDYSIVMNALLRTMAMAPIQYLQVEIVGKATDEFLRAYEDDIQLINSGQHKRLLFSTTYMDDYAFNEKLLSADYILENLIQSTDVDSPELYGISKETGLTFFTDLYRLKLIYKNDFVLSEFSDFRKIKYSNVEELAKILIQIQRDATEIIKKRESKVKQNEDYICYLNSTYQNSIDIVLGT
jgi:hypothetical protein